MQIYQCLLTLLQWALGWIWKFILIAEQINVKWRWGKGRASGNNWNVMFLLLWKQCTLNQAHCYTKMSRNVTSCPHRYRICIYKNCWTFKDNILGGLLKKLCNTNPAHHNGLGSSLLHETLAITVIHEWLCFYMFQTNQFIWLTTGAALGSVGRNSVFF